MDFVCVKARPRYGAVYVNKLYKALATHYDQTFVLYCLTDDEDGICEQVKCMPLIHDVKGWWHKIQVFELSVQLNSTLCFLDLDTVIVGSLNFLDCYPGDFALLEDFYRPGGFATGVMLLSNGYGENVYKPFLKDPEGAMASCEPGQGPTWGDQRWIEMTVKKVDLLQKLWPRKFISFKADIRKTMQLPYGSVVLCYHGEPRPHHFSERVFF